MLSNSRLLGGLQLLRSRLSYLQLSLQLYGSLSELIRGLFQQRKLAIEGSLFIQVLRYTRLQPRSFGLLCFASLTLCIELAHCARMHCLELQ